MDARDAFFLSVLLLGSSLSVLAQTTSTQRAAPQVDPDANAYRALAAGNQAELANWRSKGGDAGRYAKENPEAIYDAMRSDRDIDILEFVLNSGANPNAQRNPNLKGTPIFANILDRDKIALLIKYGADVNARDYSGYAPLSHVLFSPTSEFKVPTNPRADQKVRVFTKVEVVRLLVDSGAEVNGNLGGWGHDGALGLARREDNDVIDLLVERGATLKDSSQGQLAAENRPIERGPLTIAIQQDRDDLALALLRRDNSIAANDNLALLEATRRGYSEAALAILNAKADPNVTDAQGATSLGWALRRKDAVLTVALRRAGANTPAKPFKPKINARNLDSFGLKMADEIDEVALFDPYRFYLATYEPMPDVVFAFYGNGMGQFESIKCERAAGFSIIAQQNTQGSIQVGICKSEAKRVRDAAHWAKVALAQLVNPLAQSVPKPQQLRSIGWEWHTAKRGGGWQEYSFPVVAIGHGIAWINTVVLINQAADRAVIVQAGLNQLCEPSNGIRTRIRTPLCDETTKALTEIALAVARKS